MINKRPSTPAPVNGHSLATVSSDWRVTPLGEQVLESVNGQTFDRIGAHATLQEVFQDQLRAEDKLYVVVGSDSGHLINYVSQSPPPKGTRFFFIDTPAAHDALHEKGVIEHLPQWIRCASSDQWLDELSDFQLKEYLFIDQVEVVFSLAARSNQSQEYVQLAWDIRETIAGMRWETLASLGLQSFVVRQIENAADNFLSATLWQHALAGKTGMLLAGGPSLDPALDWVIRHRQQLVVIAVSRISRRLLEAGIEPDFVVSVDPQYMSYEICRDMMRFSDAVTFINQYHVPPQMLGQWPHRSMFLGNVLPWNSKLNPTDPISVTGPTVTNTALDFAGAMGLKRILLAGVDLCFSPEGHTHAKGSFERQVGPRFALTQLEVETNEGQQASTTADYAAAIKMLERQADHWDSRGVEIITSSAGAARIEKIRYQPLDTIQLNDDDIPAIRDIGQAQDVLPNRLRHARAVVREMKRKLDEIASLHKELTHARRIVDKLFDANGIIQNRNLRLKLDKLESSINAAFPDVYRLIQMCSVQALLRSMNSNRNVDELDAKEVKSALARYYDTLLMGADRLGHLLRRGLERAQSRVREYDNTATLSQLEPVWLSAQEPGRFRLWLKCHHTTESMLDAESTSALNRLKAALEKDISTEAHGHLQRLKPLADLTAAHLRIEHLFAQKNAHGIRKVMAGLEESQDKARTLPYLALASGLLAELDQKMDEALGHYDAVLQSDQRPLWTTALLRTASWALQNEQPEYALQALDCLQGLSSRYRPQYADLLAVVGDVKAAIGVYEQHLVEHPNDLHNMSRLTRLLINAGATDAAEHMLAHMEAQPGTSGLVAPLRGLLAMPAP